MLGPGDRNATSLHVDIKISLFSLSSLYSLSLMPWGLGGGLEGVDKKMALRAWGESLKVSGILGRVSLSYYMIEMVKSVTHAF